MPRPKNKATKPKLKTISMQIDEDIIKVVDSVAIAEARTRSNMIFIILRDWVNSRSTAAKVK